MRYFIAGNLWLLVALILLVGRTYERSSPLRYSFMHLAWFEPTTYTALIVVTAVLGVVFLVLSWRGSYRRD
jgi:hypothetical protein